MKTSRPVAVDIKKKIISLLGKISIRKNFKKLSVPWKGAVLGLGVFTIILYSIQAYIIFSLGGIRDVLLGGFQLLLLVLGLGLAVSLVIYYLKKLPGIFMLLAFTSYILLVLVFYAHPILSFILPIGVLLSLSLGGAWVFDYIRERKGQVYKFQAKKGLAFILSLCFILGLGLIILIPGQKTLKMLDLVEGEQKSVKSLNLKNPADQGQYPVAYSTYGPENTYRDIFNRDSSLVSRSVDGSAFVKDWSSRRTRTFDFGPDELPLNGHVWYPQVEGQYPQVLIVHGNHPALDYSDMGYEYLGKFLASKGYVVVAIDENFLNLSLYEDMVFVKPLKDENACRAWLLLEHLSLMEEWNNNVKSPLYQKIDLDNIALIGHSRGGEAIAIASIFNKMKGFNEDPEVKFAYNFNIKGLVSLAGVDGQYLPGGEPIVLEDIDYLSLQGSHDMDVSTYRSYNQYDRVKFSGNRDNFKASIYIYGANHGQFNSDWGRNDFLGIGSRVLNDRNLIPREDQEEITKVFLGAFLDTSLKNQRNYVQVFQNKDYARAWLPEGLYISDYWDSNSLTIVNFKEDVDVFTGSLDGASIEAEDLSIWKEEFVRTKYGDSVGNSYKAVNLAWDSKSGINPSYTISFDQALNIGEGSQFVFSLADKGSENFDQGDGLMNFTIDLEDENSNKARLLLSDLGILYPIIEGDYMKWPFNIMGMNKEVVFQNYSIDMDKIKLTKENFDMGSIKRISFIFDQLDEGNIYLRNIGLRQG